MSDATLRQGALIIHPRAAKQPAVTRLDLKSNPHLVFTVQSDAEGSHVGYASGAATGVFIPVASFPGRHDADKLLEAINRALSSAGFPWKKLLLGAVGLFVLLFVIAIIAQLVQNAQIVAAQQAAVAASREDTQRRLAPGQPQDADDALRAPQ